MSRVHGNCGLRGRHDVIGTETSVPALAATDTVFGILAMEASGDHVHEECNVEHRCRFCHGNDLWMWSESRVVRKNAHCDNVRALGRSLLLLSV